MVAKNSQKGNHEKVSSVEKHVSGLHRQLEVIEQWVHQAAAQGEPAHVVEREVFRQVLELGGQLFQAFLSLVGPGDYGEEATLDDGQRVRRLQDQHQRRLLTVFGAFTLSRWVYAQREGAKIDFAPTDQRLQLPESDLSYLLQEWDQLLGVETAFAGVRDTLTTILGLRQSVDTLERTSQRMAEAAPVFREAQEPVNASKEGELLVATEDNKGIPMVRPVEEKPVGAHRAKGEKANKKQMACIGCVYSVDRHVRTVEEMVKMLFRDEDRAKQQHVPKAQQKRYWAELSRQIDGVAIRGQDVVFDYLRQEIAGRRRPGQVLLNLCDGQRSLETDRQTYLPQDANTVDILDLMHVLPRLWEAAHLFHREGSDEASQFVRERLTRVLEGQVGRVLGGFRQLATRHGLKGSQRKRLKTICDFLDKNRHRMRYHEYLQKGYPIATGVIEGACRHVIKDRMERAGMRWKVPGAQAMLHLRTIQANGDWRGFQDFRIVLETEWLYPNKTAYCAKEWPASQAA